MINLMRSEIYQILHNKKNLFFFGLAIFMGCAFVFGSYWVLSTSNDFVVTVNKQVVDGKKLVENYALITTKLTELFKTFAVNFGTVFALICAERVCNEDLATRVVNNQVAFGYSRLTIFLNKFVMSVIYAVIWFALCTVSYAISASTLYHGNVFAIIGQILKGDVLLVMPIWIAYIALMIGVNYYSTKKLQLLSLLVILTVFVSVVMNMVGSVYPDLYDFNYYLFNNLGPGNPIKWFGVSIVPILGSVYALAFLAIGYGLFERKELK